MDDINSFCALYLKAKKYVCEPLGKEDANVTVIINKSSKIKKYLEIINAIRGWIIFFKNVKISDFFNESIKSNLARANPNDSRTQGRAKSDIKLRIFIK